MKSVGSRNSTRGNKVQKIIAERYGGTSVINKGYDVELENCLLEVKSCLSWQYHQSKDKSRPTNARVLINVEKHETLKQKADEKNKKAIYAFVKIPRQENGKIERNSEEWLEAWVRWEYLDGIFKNPETRRVVKCESKSYGVRYYYRIPLKLIFGKN